MRRTTSLRGAGLIEAIADEEIEALAARQPRAIAGRPAHVLDLVSGRERVGRFGWKAQHATLETIAGEAYRNELGITNELFPEEIAPNGNLALLAAMDPTPDPEAEPGALNKLADFMRLLAPPAFREGEGAQAEQVGAGARAFEHMGCQSCHFASFVTESPEPALDQRNGRASSLDQAIRMHAGQALEVRQSYENLEPEERAAVIAFLTSL
jgi:CxxC motif-containing protein (DUF1111 family)